MQQTAPSYAQQMDSTVMGQKRCCSGLGVFDLARVRRENTWGALEARRAGSGRRRGALTEEIAQRQVDGVELYGSYELGPETDMQQAKELL